MAAQSIAAALVCLVAVAIAHPHPQFEEVKSTHNRNVGLKTEQPIIGGTADSWKFEYQPDLLQLPAGVSLENGHGLCKDKDGNIYFTFQSTAVTDSTRALVRFNPDGTNGTLLGPDNTLANGVPHGLRISHEEKGSFLYHANNEHIIHKTDLEGNIIWTNNLTTVFEGTKYWPLKPTDSMVPPSSDVVYLSDGYGSSYVHKLDVTTGVYTNKTFGGPGAGTAPQQFHCPHGINYDTRTNRILVSDRGNNRLQWVDSDGDHLATASMATGSPLAPAGTQPCNVDFMGEYALVPGLDGPVGILDGNNTIVSVIEAGTLLKQHCPHPHDAIFLDNGDVVICCWNPGFLTYWKRIA